MIVKDRAPIPYLIEKCCHLSQGYVDEKLTNNLKEIVDFKRVKLQPNIYIVYNKK